MSNNKIYDGPFAMQLQTFISEKRLLGCKYIEEERLSYEFDILSFEMITTPVLSMELINKFIEPKPNWQATTQKRHISFIKNFANYLINHDYEVQMPIIMAIKNSSRVSYRPYIFTHDEIIKLFDAIDSIHPIKRNSHIFYPVIIRLLYSTGIRISEALNLKMGDVNYDEYTIHIVNPKNNKDRIIPIDQSLVFYLRWYENRIHETYDPEELFFFNNGKSKQYHRNNVQVYFSNILEKLNFPIGGYNGNGPHLHCLRHTFCVHSLQRMLENNIPQEVALQYLSAYMGHQTIAATSKYLQLTAEAFSDITQKIESKYPYLLPCLSVKEGADNEK